MHTIDKNTAKRLFTRLQSEKRAKAADLVCNYLQAKEAESSPAAALSLRSMRYAIKAGSDIVPAVKAALPHLNDAGAKQASAALCKEASNYKPAPSSKFTGSVADGNSFLKTAARKNAT